MIMIIEWKQKKQNLINKLAEKQVKIEITNWKFHLKL